MTPGSGRDAQDHFDASGIAPDKFAVTPQQAAWREQQVELVRQLAADEEPADTPVAPVGTPIVFLDIDDLVCLNDPYGRYAAHDCVTAKRIDVDLVYARPFPKAVLRVIHETMNAQLRYVITSTWRESFTRAQLRHVFRKSWLGFIADCMESRLPSAFLAEPDTPMMVASMAETLSRATGFKADLWRQAPVIPAVLKRTRILCGPQLIGDDHRNRRQRHSS